MVSLASAQALSICDCDLLWASDDLRKFWRNVRAAWSALFASTKNHSCVVKADAKRAPRASKHFIGEYSVWNPTRLAKAYRKDVQNLNPSVWGNRIRYGGGCGAVGHTSEFDGSAVSSPNRFGNPEHVLGCVDVALPQHRAVFMKGCRGVYAVHRCLLFQWSLR